LINNYISQTRKNKAKINKKSIFRPLENRLTQLVASTQFNAQDWRRAEASWADQIRQVHHGEYPLYKSFRYANHHGVDSF